MDYLIWDYVEGLSNAKHTIEALRWIYKNMKQIPGQFICYKDSPEMPSVVITGHSHRRILYHNFKWEDPVRLNHTYKLSPEPEKPVLISPGSAGFSREADDRESSYAVLCLKGNVVRSVTFHKTPFDREAVRRQMEDKLYPEDIIKLL